jgi:hypothetical protein
MKKRERIMSIREQSDQKVVREKLWYFSEESAVNFSPIQEKEDSEKLESYAKFIRGRNEQPIPNAVEKNSYTRECSFVVDWQLSDNI